MPLKHTIIVIGSTNTDMVIKADSFPAAGETIMGGKFFMNPGGKGANQAVAAARLGGEVLFITKTGNDVFGRQAIEQFQAEGIRTSHILTDAEQPSGVALITVDKNGENSIVVAPGANNTLSVADLSVAENEVKAADIVLLQLEIPLSTVVFGAKMAFEANKKVILNPAPAANLPAELYRYLYLITPNQTEAELLTGIKVTDLFTAEKAALALTDKGVKQVVITMGSKGAFVFGDGCNELIEAPRVQAVDTTAAGDIFNGALTVALAEQKTLKEAVIFGNKAAALSVTRMGAQASAPYKKEIV